MTPNLRIAFLPAATAVLLWFSPSPIEAQSGNPGLAMVDNRFVVLNLTTADPEHSNRTYYARDFQLNSLIHYNTRIALSTPVVGTPPAGDASAPALVGPAPGANSKAPATASANVLTGNGN